MKGELQRLFGLPYEKINVVPNGVNITNYSGIERDYKFRRKYALDNEKIILSGSLPILKKAIPEASIYGFTKPSEAMEFARNTPVDLAFLDIEMGKRSGLTVCKDLLDINPKTNVVFLTAYEGYSLDAWNTGASGFLMKPLTVEAVQKQLPLLRNRIRGLSNG